VSDIGNDLRRFTKTIAHTRYGYHTMEDNCMRLQRMIAVAWFAIYRLAVIYGYRSSGYLVAL